MDLSAMTNTPIKEHLESAVEYLLSALDYLDKLEDLKAVTDVGIVPPDIHPVEDYEKLLVKNIGICFRNAKSQMAMGEIYVREK